MVNFLHESQMSLFLKIMPTTLIIFFEGQVDDSFLMCRRPWQRYSMDGGI